MKNKKAYNKPKHRQHKSRPLHRRISLHPITILLLLCVGVLMLGSSFQVFGAATSVNMAIVAPPLNDPAIITDPSDNARFSVPDITVRGTCPADSYVKIYRNQAFNGAAPCIEGKFEIKLTLREGANTLQVKVFNQSNTEGPKSDAVTVYYDVPKKPAVSATTLFPTQAKAASASEPLRIVTDYNYKVFASKQPVQLGLALAGGVAPYALAIDWNDGNISPIPRPDRSGFQVSHVYEEKSRLYTYIIKVAASDLEGNTDYIQLMAVVDSNAPPQASISSTQSPAINTVNQWLQTWQKYLWPAYLIIVLMVLSFYLGEREERRILTRQSRAS